MANKYVREYQKIVNSLVEKDFPTLIDKKIIIEEKKAKWRAHVMYYPWGMYIYVSEQIRNFPKNKIKIILFHELCHLQIFRKWGWIWTNIEYFFYSISEKYRTKIEKDANILMIKKGYGKEILAVRKENLERGLTFSLTAKEIKYYMNNLE